MVSPGSWNGIGTTTGFNPPVAKAIPVRMDPGFASGFASKQSVRAYRVIQKKRGKLYRAGSWQTSTQVACVISTINSGAIRTAALVAPAAGITISNAFRDASQ